MIDQITRSVASGEKVSITGFGVFEKRSAAARVGRNPRTGETVKSSRPPSRSSVPASTQAVVRVPRSVAKTAPGR